MFCKNCGNELSERAKFCPQCGGTVEAAEEATEKISEEVQEEAPAPAEETAENTADSDTPAVTMAEMEAENAEAATDRPEEQPSEEAEASGQPAEPTAPAESMTQSASYALSEAETDVQAPPKKSKKGIIIGASAAAVVAGAAAAGYFCFSNELMHLFMGDAGFAEIVEGNSVEYISGGEIKTEEIDAALADYAEQMFYGGEAEETELTKSMLDEVLSLYGNSSVKVTTEIDPGMLLAMADTEGMLDLFNTESVIEAVQGEDCDRITYILNENGSRVFGADLYLQEEKTVILMPELTSQSFYADPEVKEDEEQTERAEFSEAEMKRIREELVKIYTDKLEDMDVQYVKSDADIVLSECVVEDERVIIRISAENLNAMLKEMGDFLRNDEYLRNYYVEATGNDISEYEKNFDEAEYDSAAEITIENYITDRAVVTGKKIIVTETDSETGKVFDMSFETTLGNCDFYAGDDELSVAMTQRKTDEESGTMELTINGEEMGAPLVLAVDYSGVGTAEYCGQPVNTGKYTIRVSEKDEFFDYILSESASEDNGQTAAQLSSDFGSDMDLSSVVGMLKDIKIESSVECDGASVKSSFAMEIPLFFDVIFTAEVTPLEAEKPVMPDYSQAIDINSDLEGAEYDDLRKEIYENLLVLAEKSELIGALAELAGLDSEF